MQTFRRARRQYEMIHVRPVGQEHAGIERAAIHRRALASAKPFRRAQQALLEAHGHKHGLLVLRRAHARVVQIERVVFALHRRHVDVHELDGRVSGVVDCVRMSHPHRRSRDALQHRRAAVDRELRFAVEDDEHLFGGVMEVVADAAARRDLAAMKEIEIRLQRAAGQERHAVHVADAAVRPARAIPAGVVMADALGKGGALRMRILPRERERKEHDHQERQRSDGSHVSS